MLYRSGLDATQDLTDALARDRVEAAWMVSLAEAVAAAERVDVGAKTELLSLCGLEGTHTA